MDQDEQRFRSFRRLRAVSTGIAQNGLERKGTHCWHGNTPKALAASSAVMHSRALALTSTSNSNPQFSRGTVRTVSPHNSRRCWTKGAARAPAHPRHGLGLCVAVLENLLPGGPPLADVRWEALAVVLAQQRAARDAREVFRVEIGVRLDVDAVVTHEDVLGADLRSVGAARRAHNLARRVNRRRVEVGHPDLLVAHVERRLELRLLRRDARRAVVRVALERLDTAECEHHRARGVAQISAEGDRLDKREAVVHLATGDDADLLPQISAHEHRVHQSQALSQRHADRILKLGRRRARAALRPVHRHEIDSDPS
mmetsp:Transcript_12521/g.24235  ORF Transcript_12521/g.24235 Transcript_12521/m.24235 type:complete len:313 (+) Transcript_12521:118-1056(+)